MESEQTKNNDDIIATVKLQEDFKKSLEAKVDKMIVL